MLAVFVVCVGLLVFAVYLRLADDSGLWVFTWWSGCCLPLFWWWYIGLFGCYWLTGVLLGLLVLMFAFRGFISLVAAGFGGLNLVRVWLVYCRH